MVVSNFNAKLAVARAELPEPSASDAKRALTGIDLPEASASMDEMFWKPIWKLAHDRYYWAPKRLARTVWTLLHNVRAQVRILRVLSRPTYKRLIKVNPRLPFKYTAMDYLARGLTVPQHVECFIHHYRRLPDALSEDVLEKVLLEDILLDEMQDGGNRFAIRMGFSRPWDYEGELSLNLEVNGEIVFVLSFTIVPGSVVGSEMHEVVLISRVQGVRGCYGQIQIATKALCDVAPPAVLFAALCGIAKAFGIRAMAGITADMKPEFHLCEGEANHIQEAYDGFFAELGAIRGPREFYLAPLPPPEKPMALIKRGHKLRTKRKRALKRQIAERVCCRLLDAREGEDIR